MAEIAKIERIAVGDELSERSERLCNLSPVYDERRAV